MKKIYYKKFLPTRRVKVTNFKGVSLDGYSKSLPIEYSLKQENLKVLNGALVSSLSPKSVDLVFDEKINKIIPYNENGLKLLVVLESKNYILKMQDGSVIKSQISKTCDIHSAAVYRYGEDNFVILATSNGLKKLQNEVIEDCEITTNFATICNHFYRIFGAAEQSTKLLFSDDFAPFNWAQGIDEGGYINLSFENGNINDLISFNQNLIVCQEDGFTKITAYSEQDEFVVKTITSPNNIKKSSVANCGDVIMYATNKGLGVFDGYNCVTVCEELAGFLEDREVTAVATGNYCYFLCKAQNDSIKDNFIIAYNLVFKNYHFITCDKAYFLCKVKFENTEKVLLCYENEIKMLSDESNNSSKIWASGKIDFGSPAEYKLLKRIVFGGDSIIDLKINADGKNYFYNISGQRATLLNLKGKEFEIEIVPKGININVPSPVIEYSVLEEN